MTAIGSSLGFRFCLFGFVGIGELPKLKQYRVKQPRQAVIALLGVLLTAVGCSSQEPFEYVPASGSVTYEDGSPIGKGGFRLQFVSQDQPVIDGFYPRPAQTNVDGQGKFDSVTSHKFGDGLLPGKHKVAILSGNDEKGKPLILKEYTHAKTTPLVVDTANLPFDIKVPRP